MSTAGLANAGISAYAATDQAARLRALMQRLSAGAVPIAADPPAPVSAPWIAICSGKGGVGKTNAAVNIAIALAQRSIRATLVDADLGMANADVLCGLTPLRRLDSTVGDDSVDPGTLMRLAVRAPGGFTLVPGAVGVARMADLNAGQRDALLRAMVSLEDASDVVIVDTGAGLGPGVLTFAHAADATLVVATPEPTSIADAYALIKCMVRSEGGAALSDARHGESGVWGHGAGPSRRVWLLVNQATDEREAFGVHARLAATCSRFLGFTPSLIGWITDDPAIPWSVRRRTPLLLACPRCRASRDVRRVAGKVAQALSLGRPPGSRGSVASRSWRQRLVSLLGP